MQPSQADHSEINFYDKVKALTMQQGWVTVKLIQHTFRLSYLRMRLVYTRKAGCL